MPDPDDFKSTLDDLESAMFASQGKSAPVLVPEQPKQTRETPISDKYTKAAQEDLPRIASLRGKMEQAARRHRVPAEYLEAIASRESRGGKVLNDKGFDPDKQAYGVMQVDQNYHQLEGATSPDSQEHINQAAGILRDNKRQIDKKFPKWSEEERWRAAIAAYNMGTGNIRTREHLDQGTTGGDYSQDVLIRAKTFKKLLTLPKKRR